jgi:nuclease-like protein
MTVLRERTQVRIRLYGVDCPETGQDFGVSCQAVHLGAGFREDRASGHGPLRADRGAEVVLTDGLVLNEELVRAGLAWWYRQYTQDIGTLSQLEAKAREAKRVCGQNRTRCRPGSGVGRSERPLGVSWRGNSLRTAEVASTTPRAAGTWRRFRRRIGWCLSRLKPRRERATDRAMTVIRDKIEGYERVPGRRGGLLHRCVL